MAYNDIYRTVIGKNQAMNPETDDLLYGDELDDEMLVLTAPEFRGDQDSKTDKLLRDNRWCRITKLREETGGIFFIGVYEDGQKYLRHSLPLQPWVVKKHTIPVTSEDGTTKKEREETLYQQAVTALRNHPTSH